MDEQNTRKALQTLNWQEAAVMYWRCQGQNAGDIAEALNYSEATIWGRLREGRKKLEAMDVTKDPCEVLSAFGPPSKLNWPPPDAWVEGIVIQDPEIIEEQVVPPPAPIQRRKQQEIVIPYEWDVPPRRNYIPWIVAVVAVAIALFALLRDGSDSPQITPEALAQEISVSSTPQPTLTPQPTQEIDVAATGTAMAVAFYAQLTQEAPQEADTPIPTLAPTNTVLPTSMPSETPTTEPDATVTPAPTATASFALPFNDDFADGVDDLWRISGDYLIEDGWLKGAGGPVTLTIGDDSLTGYSISFNVAEMPLYHNYITWGDVLRFGFHPGHRRWEARQNGQWTTIASDSAGFRAEALEARVEGNRYQVYGDGDLVDEIIYGSAYLGPVSIRLVNDRPRISNVRIEPLN